MNIQTMPGQCYCVTSVAGCTVTDSDGKTLATIPAGGQGTFQATTVQTTVGDDSAVVLPFDAAPALLGSVGGGSGGGSALCNISITDQNNIACGTDASVYSGGGSVVIGYKAKVHELTSNNYTTVSSSNFSVSVAYGAHATASCASVAVGGAATAGSVPNTGGKGNTAVGCKARAGGGAAGATSCGYAAEASGNYAVAIGDSAQATEFVSLSIGNSACATGYSAMACGSYSRASAVNSVACGAYAAVVKDNSASFGFSAFSSGNSGTAIGYAAKTNGCNSVACGSNSRADGYASTALGSKCYNEMDGSAAMTIGFEPPGESNNYVGCHWQMYFYANDGKPYIGFAKFQMPECAEATPTLLESYAVDLSLLPHVLWQPSASQYDSDGNFI